MLLGGIFSAMLLLTNVITVKYFEWGGVVLTAGALTYPFTFSILDIVSEVYGRARAQAVVWIGFVVSILSMLLLHVASCLPTYQGSPVSQAVFEQVFGFTPGIVIGSMVAYLAAQLTDVALFAWIAQVTGGRHLWLRNNVSTLVSQLIDTVLFGWVAWVIWPWLSQTPGVAPLPWAVWCQIVMNEYAFKVLFTVLNTPLVYGGVYVLRRLCGLVQ